MRIVKVIIVMLLSMVLFTGCSGCETPQTVYLIGEEYTFETIKVKLENELNIKQKRYNELNNDINDNINEESKNKMINEYINKFLSMKEPSRELIINLIDRIEIFEDKTININVSFNKNKKIKLSIDNFCKIWYYVCRWCGWQLHKL